MKKYTSLMLLCGLVLTAEGLNAGAPPPKAPAYVAPEPCSPWFSAISAGPFWLQDIDIDAGAGVRADIEFDTGWGINVTPIGYQLSDMISLSLNTGYYTADFDSLTVAGVGFALDGDVEIVPVMANVALEFPIADRLSFFVGGGLGVVYTDTEIGVPALAIAAQDDDWNFGIQGTAGLAYEIVQCVDLTLAYRYQHVFEDDDEDLQGHSIEAGILIHW